MLPAARHTPGARRRMIVQGVSGGNLTRFTHVWSVWATAITLQAEGLPSVKPTFGRRPLLRWTVLQTFWMQVSQKGLRCRSVS